MSERKLATIRRIAEIKPIENADAICAYRVDGWWVVDSIAKYQVGDLVCYCEPDSWIPHTLAPFLSKGKAPREFNGVSGARLRTIKLRGQLSQGLLLHLTNCCDDYIERPDCFAEGEDFTEALGIQKWERPIHVRLQGQIRGSFPEFIRKTDQERIQNLWRVLDDQVSKYEVTIKLDGSSMTVYQCDGGLGVCSRNINLKIDQDGNAFVDTAKRIFGEQFPWDSIAIQGELMGPGIQGNREGLTHHEFYVFDVWDIAAQEYWSPSDVEVFCESNELHHVPVLHEAISLGDLGIDSVDGALAFAEGPSLNHRMREGVVFKRVDGQCSWKAVSNLFLLKEKD